jgi:hypothetical protein
MFIFTYNLTFDAGKERKKRIGTYKSEGKNLDERRIARIILASVTLFFLVLLGYIVYVSYVKYSYEWIIFCFHVSPYAAFFSTLLIFGIFVLPFILADLGWLDF